jgi:GR25 family glycosyltransferase involved in LPS biosynthesis
MEELEKQSLNAHLYPAKINKIGWMGCRDSHLSLLVKIYAEEFAGMIAEDDCKFIEDFDVAALAMLELPEDWDMLSLGASPQEPQVRYSPSLYKLSKSWCTHAMIWNPRKGGAVEAILQADDNHEIGKYDVFLSEKIYPNFNCFLVRPLVCTQENFQSDIARRSDVGTIAVNYARFCE